MRPIRTILVAIKDPMARSLPAVEKAAQLAHAFDARLVLFHAMATPVYIDAVMPGLSPEEVRRHQREHFSARLDVVAERLRKDSLHVTTATAWDFPPHEAIVRRAAAIHADLIVAECHEGKRLTPWLMHLTDWELLRTSPRPVLVLKNDRDWRDPVVLGAVDPSHAHAKPEQLDAGIVAAGEAMSRAFGGSFELLHANFPATFALMTGDAAMDAAALTQAYDQQRANSKAEFDAFASKMRVPRASRHLLDTDPGFAIPHMARKLGADLVVMGAVSRSGLKRVFIGNTAERVLEALPCDVLVIKPTRFPRRVSRASRGMRVVPPQPLMPLPV